MKNYILIPLLALLLLACKPDSRTIKSIQKEASGELTIVEKPEHPVQTFEVRVTVPDSGWSLAISDVLLTDNEIAVIAKLTKADGMSMQVISEVLDAVTFYPRKKKIQVYVLGKTWSWENSGSYKFVDNVSGFKGESILISRVKPSSPGGPKKQAPDTLL